MSTKQIAWQTGSGNITLTYQGQGNGTISVVSDANNGSARSQIITIQTTKGGLVTKNVTVSQAACPIPVGTVLNYAYTGSYQEVTLPAGRYKLQCWGAQGGTCSSGYSGGKGGYSEGVLTLTSPTTVYIFVGGQGGQYGNGGWNGGGGGSGSSSYSSSDEYGSSTFGCGGGATDIALVTSSMDYSSYRNNRSSASLLSRMIVAGGGSGGAYGYQEETTTTTTWDTIYNGGNSVGGWSGPTTSSYVFRNIYLWYKEGCNSERFSDVSLGDVIKVTSNISPYRISYQVFSGSTYVINDEISNGGTFTLDSRYSNYNHVISIRYTISSYDADMFSVEFEKEITTSSTYTDSDSKAGYVGGGTNGGGYSSSYYGKQNGAGSNGSFGLGANQTVTNYRYASGAGGGGWYGGGNSYSDSGLSTIRCSGGGSGFVNTAANAQYRPSGYTGLQLDSGETKAGNTSFPAPGGGNETGHAGNGYARITRLS